MDHDHSMHNHDHHEHMMPASSSEPSVDHTAHNHHDHGAPEQSPVEHMVHHMMSMAFHGGYKETILIEPWSIDSMGGLLASMLVIFIMAVLYEGLKYYREHLFWKSYNALQYRAVSLPEKNVVNDDNSRVVHMVGEVIHKQPPSMCSVMHFYQSFLHLIQVTLSFLLMLIFMTYNTWLCIAVVLGAGFGYFLFGWKKSVIVDVTEHCH